jgi:hypothetical protein
MTILYRLPEPRRPGSRIYVRQEQGGPVITPGTVFMQALKLKLKLIYDRLSVDHLSWCQAPVWDPRPIFLSP